MQELSGNKQHCLVESDTHASLNGFDRNSVVHTGLVLSILIFILAIAACFLLIPRIHYNLKIYTAEQYLERADYTTALLVYDEAIALNDQKTKAYEGKARVYHTIGKEEEAIDIYSGLLMTTGNQKYQEIINYVKSGNTQAPGNKGLVVATGMMNYLVDARKHQIVNINPENNLLGLAEVIQLGANEDAFDLNLWNNHLWFLKITDGGLGSLCEVDLLADEPSVSEKGIEGLSKIQLYNNIIYYLKGNEVFSYDPESGTSTSLYLGASQFLVNHDKLYVIGESQQELKIFENGTLQKTIALEHPTQNFYIDQDSFFYLGQDDQVLYELSLTTQDVQVIAANCQILNADYTNLYYLIQEDNKAEIGSLTLESGKSMDFSALESQKNVNGYKIGLTGDDLYLFEFDKDNEKQILSFSPLEPGELINIREYN